MALMPTASRLLSGLLSRTAGSGTLAHGLQESLPAFSQISRRHQQTAAEDTGDEITLEVTRPLIRTDIGLGRSCFVRRLGAVCVETALLEALASVRN